jgi:hypothetical protein
MKTDQKERLKLIVKNLKLLIESLEFEMFSDVDDCLPSNSENFDDEITGHPIESDFEEMFDDWEYDWSDTQMEYKKTNDTGGNQL